MTMRYSSLYTSPILSPNHVPIKGSTKSRVAMCANTSHFSVKALSISSVKNKVFEDQSVGVVCYEDENGEIICEGVDEGPRFQPQLSIFESNNSRRSIEIIDLFQRCWLQPIDEDHELESED
ncbi:hypothetical protein F511_26618 [Dorcoceras hygrometricum]|uniref:Uncharacterized protein n=1 Tax=Dorcoceras hygrometricum TaxID=472368 RepID=A0A2Z7BR76_9LAMI|nr:hypothetical protein F511_26618 [Dorcoceras hygrometricum]